MPIVQSRRRFLSNAAFAGAAGLGGVGAVGFGHARRSFAAEPPPEITTLRLERESTTCIAPTIFDELLRTEGFTDIRYVDLNDELMARGQAEKSGGPINMMAHDEIDIGLDVAPAQIAGLEAGAPVTILAGLHSGCFEVLGKPDIRNISDLKGRTVGAVLDSGDFWLLKIMAGAVGLDLGRDIHWVMGASIDPMQLFVDGKIDAFVAYPPQLQELRARNIGRLIVSAITDRPWSQYFCCLLAARAEFVHRYPVATKRALRAIFKAADLCVSQPSRMAQLLVERGFAENYDYTLQALREIRYDAWREYDPEDTLRFYGLRMQEVGIIKSSPQRLVAEHADWRFLNELKRELKT